MPDQPNDTNKNAIRLALGAALGSALGIITAVRTLSGARREQDRATAAPTAMAVRDRDHAGPDDAILPIGTAPPEGKPASPPQPEPHPDWEPLPAAHLPRPTYWPVVLAVGILFLAWGIVTTIGISVIGLALFALALGGWIGELHHGH